MPSSCSLLSFLLGRCIYLYWRPRFPSGTQLEQFYLPQEMTLLSRTALVSTGSWRIIKHCWCYSGTWSHRYSKMPSLSWFTDWSSPEELGKICHAWFIQIFQPVSLSCRWNCWTWLGGGGIFLSARPLILSRFSVLFHSWWMVLCNVIFNFCWIELLYPPI